MSQIQQQQSTVQGEREVERSGISDNRSCISLPTQQQMKRATLKGSRSAKHLSVFVSNSASNNKKATGFTQFTVMETVRKIFACQHNCVLKLMY